MDQHQQSKLDGREILRLTKWELENLHLPPVTTVTLYEGTAPVEFLRHRLAMILRENPWLNSRIVKRSTSDGVVALAYPETFESESIVEQIFKVYEHGDVGVSLNIPYEALVQCLSPVQCARSKQATDEDEPLFKVAVIPIEAAETDDSHPFWT